MVVSRHRFRLSGMNKISSLISKETKLPSPLSNIVGDYAKPSYMDIINNHPNKGKYEDEYIRISVDIVDWTFSSHNSRRNKVRREDFIYSPEFRVNFFNWDGYGFIYYNTINTKDFILSLNTGIWRDDRGVKIVIPKKFIAKMKRFLDRIMVF